jgi:mannose-1-phosphate guanylyltransferase
LRAVLLAAGFGTRLRPLTESLPKCLVPVQGKPLMAYWFDLLFSAGLERVLVNTHYLPDAVTSFVAQSPWAAKVDLVHEDLILGTGGTLLTNVAWFKGRAFMVAHADNLTVFDVQGFWARHRDRPEGCVITMMTFDTDAPQTCGIVEERGGVVVAFHEKVANPPGTRANAAVYIFEPEAISFIASLNKAVVDLSTEVLPHFIGRMYTFHNSHYHRDIGSLESLALAEREFGNMCRPGS